MSTVDNPFQAALDAFKTGKDVEQEVYGAQEAPVSGDEGTTPSDSDEFNSESFMGGTDSTKVGSSEQEGTDGTTKSDSASDKDQKPQDVEEIFFTDDTGRKKVKVDWNDRTKLKKYIEQAAGMRKFQADRDKATQKLSQMEPEYQDLKQSWGAISSAVQEQGIRGLVNLLYKDETAYDRYMAAELDRHDKKRDASPSELKRLELEDKLAEESRKREQSEKKVQEHLSKAERLNSEASEKALSAQILPHFDKYRFAGKLGDAAAEHRYDTAVWNQAMDQLASLPDNVELSRQVIEKTFQTVSNDFRKVVKAQADKQAQKSIESKKTAAQEKVAAKAMSGYRANSTGAQDEFRSDIQSGNISGALQSLFSGKFKF